MKVPLVNTWKIFILLLTVTVCNVSQMIKKMQVYVEGRWFTNYNPVCFSPVGRWTLNNFSQRRVYSRKEAPGDSAAPPRVAPRWRRSRRRCRQWRWRRTTPATGSTSARSSARLLGSVSLFSLFTCWLRQELFTLAPFYTMTLQLKYVW